MIKEKELKNKVRNRGNYGSFNAECIISSIAELERTIVRTSKERTDFEKGFKRLFKELKGVKKELHEVAKQLKYNWMTEEEQGEAKLKS